MVGVPRRGAPRSRRGPALALIVSFAAAALVARAQDGALPFETYADAAAALDPAIAGDAPARARLVATYAALAPELTAGSPAKPRALLLCFVALGIRDDWTGAPAAADRFDLAERAAAAYGSIDMVLHASRLHAQHEANAGGHGAARKRLEAALAPAGAAASRMRPALELDLARERCALGDYAAARSLLEALAAASRARTPPYDDARFEPEALGALGQLELALGRPDRAAPSFARELELARAGGDPDTLAGALLHGANARLSAREFEGLVAAVDAALAGADAARLGAATCAELLARRGQAEAELERDDPARPKRARATLDEAARSPALSSEQRILTRLALADVCRREGDLAAARADLAELEPLLAGTEGGATLRARASATAVELALAGPSPDRAALESALAQLGRRQDEMFAAWSATTGSRAASAGFLHYAERRAVLSAWIDGTLAIDAARTQPCLAAIARAQERGTLAEALGVQGASLDAVRRALAPDAGLWLVYLPAPDHSHLFAVEGDQPVHYRLPGSRAIDEARRRFAGLVATPPSRRGAADDWRRVGDETAAMLLPGEVRSAVARQRVLTVVGVDLIGFFPFEALPDADGRPLGLGHACTYAPSIPVALGLLERARRAATSPDRTAEPKYDLWRLDSPRLADGLAERFGGLAELAPRESSLAAARAIYGEDRVIGFSGPAATRSRLAADARILEVFAHGVFDAAQDPPLCLLLAPESGDEGIVSSRDVSRLAAPPLVLHGACSATRGPLVRGEDGVTHFGGAWLQAGAVTVVLPSQDVEIEATRALFDGFHRGIAAARSPADALMEARIALAADARTADPYFHSLVHVYGNGRERIHVQGAKPARGFHAGWFALGLAALALLRAALRGRRA